MCGFELDLRSHPRIASFLPTTGANAPTVTGFESGKLIRRNNAQKNAGQPDEQDADGIPHNGALEGRDFFRREADNQLPIDAMFDRIRVNEANDTFGFIDPVDGAGIEEGEFPLEILRQVMGPAYGSLVTKAANTRPRVEM